VTDAGEAQERPFRFYDNRQKYLAFVTTCDEKWRVAERAGRELAHLKPQPPALRVFDAGVGDGTVLAHLLRTMHHRYPTVPFYVAGKEISLEDIRLTLEKLPDRLVEHPQTVAVLTNLHYSEAPYLWPSTPEKQEKLVVEYVELEGSGSHRYGEQLRALDDFLAEHWQVRPSEKTGNPLYVTPTVLVIYRADQAFALDDVIPRRGEQRADYDLIVASQPWRSRMGAEFKVKRILAPLAKSLRSHGVLLGIQSMGHDPGQEIIERIWPDEEPFPVDRHELLKVLHDELGDDGRNFDLMALPEAESQLRYSMHTLPTEIGSSIGTSTLFAAWNAAIYVAQIEDERVEAAALDGTYLDATASVLQEHGGLWFNDETFVVRRH
jgi:SAM-dependent methyltransferase